MFAVHAAISVSGQPGSAMRPRATSPRQSRGPAHDSRLSPMPSVLQASSFFQQPFMLDQIFQGADDALLNRQFRLPAQATNPSGVQKDERTVTDPAACAAGKVQLRRDAQPRTDPADRIGDLTIFI